MADEPEKGPQKLSDAEVQAIHDELGSDTLTLHRMAELLEMLPPTRVTQSSADMIRELRGPLPEDDPEYQRFIASGGDSVQESHADQEAVEAVLRDLRALPPGTTLTNEEVLAFITRLPRRPSSWTSADVIREMRGPLPDDDPEYQAYIRRTRAGE
jgi:hypothetical protein